MTWNMARNTGKHIKCEILILGPGLWCETEKRGKWDTNSVWHGMWWETLKNVKNEKSKL